MVFQNEGESPNKLKAKLKAITELVDAVIPEVEIPGITNKMGQIRKTVHRYETENLTGSFGQVREQIILEVSWLGCPEPYILADVTCYIGDMMTESGQFAMVEQFNLQPFAVNVLDKRRTFCEKVMSLVRFSQTENPYFDLSNKIRHIYDIHMMLKDGEVAAFFESAAFHRLLTVVANEDVANFKNNNQWLKIHPSKAVIFNQPAETWEKIKKPYTTTFKEMVLGVLPEELDLVNTIGRVADRIRFVGWNL